MTDTAVGGAAQVNDPVGRSSRLVPAWLENLAAVGWRLLVIVALGAVLAYLGSLIWNVVASIGLAIIVAIVLAPFVVSLRNGGRSPSSAAAIAWVVAIGVGLGLLILLAVALVPYAVEIVQGLQAGQSEVEAFVADLQLPTWLNTLVTDVIEKADGLSGEAISNAVGSVANLVGILILAVFLLYFFLRDGDKAWMWMFQAVDDDKRERITSVGDETLGRVGSYVRGTTVMATISAVTTFVFILLLGTPLALPLALLTFITAFIPYFGGAIAAILVVLVTWGAVGSTAALIMVGLLLARFVLVHLFVRPRAYEQALTVPPALILVVLPIGLQLGGLAGLILAVPLTAVVVSVAQGITKVLQPEREPSLPEIVPAWLDRVAQWSWRALVGIALAAMLGLVLTTFPLAALPVILAMIFASTVLPLFEAVLRRGRSRTEASAVSVGGATIAIVGVLALTMVSLVNQAEEIGDTTVSGAETVDEAAGGLLGLATDAIESGTESGVQTILDTSGQLAGVTLALILTVLLTFYFLRDGGRMWDRLMSHVSNDAATQLNAAGSRAFGVLGGYMVGTAAISFVGAASQAAIMFFLGLPLVMPVFVLSFFGGFIPYIGSLLTTGLAFLIAVQTGSTVDVIIMGIWTIVFNLVQGNVVAPAVYNRTTSIHPAIVLACIPAASAVAGILGMFLVVPVLGVWLASWRTILKVMGSDDSEAPSPDEEDTPVSGSSEPDTPASPPEAAAGPA
jgi:predicted PurR-regulated permease PerM